MTVSEYVRYELELLEATHMAAREAERVYEFIVEIGK